MKFDTYLVSHDMHRMPTLTQSIEEMGFDGIWTAETNHNPFFPLVLAAEHSQKVTLGTAIAVTFPRSPTVLAHIAWDLARYSNGRFILGLGSQVRAHNELRLGAKWEKPVRKMRETIEAIHALWDSWQDGTPLRYKGEFFNLRLMTPFFSGPPLAVPRPPIYISAVNEKMLKLSGRRCDGVHLHVFHTIKYLKEYAWPHIESGLSENGRTRADMQAMVGVFVVPTDGRKAAAEYEQYVKEQLSFYMSTPAYRSVIELHGWEEPAKKLSDMARCGEWQEMPNLITDEMLDAFAVSGKWGELPGIIKGRYGDLVDQVAYYLSYEPGEEDEGWATTIAGFKDKEA